MKEEMDQENSLSTVVTYICTDTTQFESRIKVKREKIVWLNLTISSEIQNCIIPWFIEWLAGGCCGGWVHHQSHCISRSGVPYLQPWTSTCSQMSNGIRLEINCTINALHLNQSQTILPSTSPWSVEKLSSAKSVPGAQKVGE